MVSFTCWLLFFLNCFFLFLSFSEEVLKFSDPNLMEHFFWERRRERAELFTEGIICLPSICGDFFLLQTFREEATSFIFSKVKVFYFWWKEAEDDDFFALRRFEGGLIAVVWTFSSWVNSRQTLVTVADEGKNHDDGFFRNQNLFDSSSIDFCWGQERNNSFQTNQPLAEQSVPFRERTAPPLDHPSTAINSKNGI